MLCQIYRSASKADYYLYTRKEQALSAVPEALLKHFGPAEPAMLLNLSADRKLARADVVKVMQSIEEKGYYLQMPPLPNVVEQGAPGSDAQLSRIDQLNDKLPRGQ